MPCEPLLMQPSGLTGIFERASMLAILADTAQMQESPYCDGCQNMLCNARLKYCHAGGSEWLGVDAAGGAHAGGLTEGERRLVLQQRQPQVHQRRLLRQRAGARVVERQPLRACACQASAWDLMLPRMSPETALSVCACSSGGHTHLISSQGSVVTALVNFMAWSAFPVSLASYRPLSCSHN